MPRFKVIKRLPALYREVYEVDAASKDEAERAIVGGQGQCRHRSFLTTPRHAQPAGMTLVVLAEAELPPNDSDFLHPDVEMDNSGFMNALFATTAGHASQYVEQRIDV